VPRWDRDGRAINYVYIQLVAADMERVGPPARRAARLDDDRDARVSCAKAIHSFLPSSSAAKPPVALQIESAIFKV